VTSTNAAAVTFVFAAATVVQVAPVANRMAKPASSERMNRRSDPFGTRDIIIAHRGSIA